MATPEIPDPDDLPAASPPSETQQHATSETTISETTTSETTRPETTTPETTRPETTRPETTRPETTTPETTTPETTTPETTTPETTTPETTTPETTTPETTASETTASETTTPETTDSDTDHQPPLDLIPPLQSPERISKFLYTRGNTYFADPGADYNARVLISSPFPNTSRSYCTGVNVALAKLVSGLFLYWGTSFQPPPGCQVSPIPLTHLPDEPFLGMGLDGYWNSVDHDQASLPDLFEGAWVLRGLRLHQDVVEQDFPDGVLDRLRGGFLREWFPELQCMNHSVHSLLRRAIASLDRIGPDTFGFTRTSTGSIACTLSQLSEYLYIPLDALAAFMISFSDLGYYFRGPAVAWLGRVPMKGPLELQQPFPDGPWMRGKVHDTGVGLLYVTSSETYYTVVKKDKVCVLSKYDGTGISAEAAPLDFSGGLVAHVE